MSLGLLGSQKEKEKLAVRLENWNTMSLIWAREQVLKIVKVIE